MQNDALKRTKRGQGWLIQKWSSLAISVDPDVWAENEMFFEVLTCSSEQQSKERDREKNYRQSNYKL